MILGAQQNCPTLLRKNMRSSVRPAGNFVMCANKILRMFLNRVYRCLWLQSERFNVGLACVRWARRPADVRKQDFGRSEICPTFLKKECALERACVRRAGRPADVRKQYSGRSKIILPSSKQICVKVSSWLDAQQTCANRMLGAQHHFCRWLWGTQSRIPQRCRNR